MAEEEFLDIQFTRDELRNIIFPEKIVTCRSCHKPRINKKLSVAHFSEEHRAKICTVGSYHPHIVHNNIQNNVQNNPQNIAPNNAPFEIQNVENVHVVHNIGPNIPPNAQDYVTRNEFIQFKNEFAEFKRNEFAEFKRTTNNQLERIIQALGGRNLNNEAEGREGGEGGEGGEEEGEGEGEGEGEEYEGEGEEGEEGEEKMDEDED